MPFYAFILMFAGIALVAFTIWLIVKSSRKYYTPDASHISVSDREILELIGAQKDGFLSVRRAIKLTGMTKSETKKRFSILVLKGLIKAGYTSSMRYYYSLKQPLNSGPFPSLSSEPFLTIGDLMILFKHFDYRLSIQDICQATNLPVVVIAKEMKVFIKEKVVDELHHISADGMNNSKFYILRGDYRDNPDKHLELQTDIDLDLSKLYAAHKSKPHK